MDRIERIHDYFEDLIRVQLGQAIATPDREMWASMPLAPEHQYGWLPPLPYNGTDGPPLLLTVCPELILEHTSACSDEEFECYIQAIGFFIMIHVAEYPQKDGTDGLPTRERTVLAEKELDAADPGIMELVSRVQLGALDRLVG